MRLAVPAVLVPLCSILGSEVWQLTANLRYKNGAPESADTTMKAVTYDRHGIEKDVLVVNGAHARPRQPAAPGMIIIKVHAAALNPVDFKQMRTEQPDLLVPKPRIAGFDVSGVVLSAGAGSGFAEGDRVYGMMPLLGSKWGALAQETAADARCFAKAPTSIPLEDAASLPLVGLTVMQVFEQAGLDSTAPSSHDGNVEKRVLVHAAAGGVGSFAVQYARNVLGYGTVLGTCSAANAERVKSLGATETIDYHHADFADVASEMGGVDVVLDPMAWRYMARTLDSRRKVLRPGAKYCHILSTDWAPNAEETSIRTVLQGPWSKWSSRVVSLFTPSAPRVFSTPVHPDGAGLARLASLVDRGLIKPNIDKYFEGLESTVEAFEYLKTGHASGKVVLRRFS